MNYRSVADAARDVGRWVEDLPRDIDMVVGIPRSGMLVATLLALNLQVPLATLDDVEPDVELTVGTRLKAMGLPTRPSEAKRILVVDDSVYDGTAMRAAKQRMAGHPLAERMQWGALYSRSDAEPGLIDFSYADVEKPRVFQWNILHHPNLRKYCMDMDGVLCRDPTEADNDDGPAYEEFLRTAVARTIPSVDIGWIVTARLEKYRAQTEDWLARHDVKYGELIMHPAASAAERRALGDHASHKAKAYRRTGAELFIESDIGQATQISKQTGLPVFCTDTQVMVYPHGDSSTGHSPRRSQQLRWELRNRVRRRLRQLAARRG